MTCLDRIRACNRHDLTRYLPFWIGDDRVGWIRTDRRPALATRPDLFTVEADAVRATPSLADFAAGSRAIAAFVDAIARDGQINPPTGEQFAVATHFGAPPRLQIDRAAVAWFGVRAVGVHLNGFVRDDRGSVSMWVARRARDKPNFPGMLDQVVAGGQPIDLDLATNLRKECAEEASIPPALLEALRPVGAVTYCTENAIGLKPDTLFCYDLELPADFVPHNTDGEVDSFELWPVERVAETVRDTEQFKPNCNLVALDFLIRHGVVGPGEPDYLDLLRELRAPLP